MKATLQFRAYLSKPAHRRLDDTLLLLGLLYNAIITHHAYTRNLTFKEARRLRNAHLTDLHQQQPEYHQLARKLLEATEQRAHLAITRFLKTPAGQARTHNPHHFHTLEISEPSVNHLHLQPGAAYANIHIKGIPTIRFKPDHRLPTDTQPRVIRITRNNAGQVTLSLIFDIIPKELGDPIAHSIGIDPGVANLIATSNSDGNTTRTTGLDDKQILRIKRRLRRKMQRQRDAALNDGRARFITQHTRSGRIKRRFRWNRKPSASYLRTMAQLRRVEHKRHVSLRNHHHHLAHQIVRDHQVICIEDTRIHNLTRSAKGTADQPGKNVKAKATLSRKILFQGWGLFRQQLAYKAAWYTRDFLAIPAQYTSQRCPKCGHIASENRQTQAVFRCQSCGHPDHADTNGAENIRRQGVATLGRAENSPVRVAGRARKSRQADPMARRPARRAIPATR